MKWEGPLGFLGFGNMGAAIAQGLVNAGTLEARELAVYDTDAGKCAAAEQLGARIVDSAAELGHTSDTLLLAVKPQNMEDALSAVKAGYSPSTLVISIAAGISINYIQARLGADARVVRVMPNTPALVGAGAAGIALSDNCTETDGARARTIFEAIGVAVVVSEDAIDAVTALSGSGPAYFFYIVECLVRAAGTEGLGEEEATRLAGQTLLGAGRLLSESGEAAAVLRERVTSKGGTTAAALATFEREGLDRVLAAGLAAAAARSRELGK